MGGNPNKYTDKYGLFCIPCAVVVVAVGTAISIGWQNSGGPEALNDALNNWSDLFPGPWGPFPNPDATDDDAEPGSGTMDDCIEKCLPLLDIGDGGAAFHKCMADCKRDNGLFPSCE